jgi:hypothetical protein
VKSERRWRAAAARVPLAGLVAAAVALAVTAAASQIPWGSATDAVVRLSWRARGERVEACRRPSAEELAALPPHMRQTEICEGRVTPFLLRLSIDGGPAVVDTLHAAGAREDRPIYVFRELKLAPGEHEIALTFEKAGGGAAPVAAPEPRVRPERTPAFPSLLELRTRVRLVAGEIGLVTYDENSRTLVLRSAQSR